MAAVHNRYARAFADVVVARKLDPATVRRELASMQAVLESSADLRRVLESPSIPAAQKRAVLDKLVQRVGVSKWVRNFLAVLIDHRRIGALAPIALQFERELDQRLGITEAEITTARELDSRQRRALEAQVQRLTGSKVRARYERDPALLGGAVVRVGSTIYDGSVRGQLQRLKEELTVA